MVSPWNSTQVPMKATTNRRPYLPRETKQPSTFSWQIDCLSSTFLTLPWQKFGIESVFGTITPTTLTNQVRYRRPKAVYLAKGANPCSPTMRLPTKQAKVCVGGLSRVPWSNGNKERKLKIMRSTLRIQNRYGPSICPSYDTLP